MDLTWDIESDDWTKITDPQQRKKIQDRLAQRSRRARRAANNPSSSHTEVDDGTALISPLGCEEKQPSESDKITRNKPPEATTLSSLDPDAFYLVLRSQTVIGALTANAASIPVHCKILVPRVLDVGNVVSPPSALMPTALQSQIPHLAFVAALPFPGLRDAILKALPYIDYDELWRDSVSGGFYIWGTLPWSPQAWEVTEEWARKWWFLVDHEVIDTANFWRSQRGLGQLFRNVRMVGEVQQ